MVGFRCFDAVVLMVVGLCLVCSCLLGSSLLYYLCFLVWVFCGLLLGNFLFAWVSAVTYVSFGLRYFVVYVAVVWVGSVVDFLVGY